MTNKPDAKEPLLACNVCMKEIPESVAKSVEAEDYVQHFCGMECFAKWEKHSDSSDSSSRKTSE